MVAWAAAGRALAGEVSGDAWAVVPVREGVLVCVVDGLGHGPKAAEASRLAVDTVKAHRSEDLASLVRRCHASLARTRGVAMALASFTGAGTMTWLGVGSVDAVLIRASPTVQRRRETLLVRGGAVGYELPELRPSTLTVVRGDTLVMTTDGVRAGFEQGLGPDLPPDRLAAGILEGFATATDDALVVVVRYLGGGG